MVTRRNEAGDLFDAAANPRAAEWIVTTLGGDLSVFDLDAGGSVGALLHHSIHDGALGANNAILVDSVSNPKSVFVADSMGLRKFTVATGGV